MNDYLSTLAERAMQRGPDFGPAPAPWFASEPAATGAAAFELPMGSDVVTDFDSHDEISDATSAVRPVEEFSGPVPRPRLDRTKERRNAELAFEVDASGPLPTAPIVLRPTRPPQAANEDGVTFAIDRRPQQPAAITSRDERATTPDFAPPTDQASVQRNSATHPDQSAQQADPAPPQRKSPTVPEELSRTIDPAPAHPKAANETSRSPRPAVNLFEQQTNAVASKELRTARSMVDSQPASALADAGSARLSSDSVRELVVHERIIEEATATAGTPTSAPIAMPRDGLASRESLPRPKFNEIVPRPQFMAPLVAPASVAVSQQPVAPPSETVVHVTIGRVEVRAQVSGPKRNAGSTPHSPGGRSLDDYLHNRHSARQS